MWKSFLCRDNITLLMAMTLEPLKLARMTLSFKTSLIKLFKGSVKYLSVDDYSQTILVPVIASHFPCESVFAYVLINFSESPTTSVERKALIQKDKQYNSQTPIFIALVTSL